MGSDHESKLWLGVVFLLGVHHFDYVVGVPEVPCLFIFGDSLSDSGNNNELLTEAKVNHLPYGIDFPAGPTGRFTHGRTAVDILTQILGFENFIPPFANTSGSDVVKGVNYASGSAGIRDESGKHMGQHVSLGGQIQHHAAIISEITKKLGGALGCCPQEISDHGKKGSGSLCVEEETATAFVFNKMLIDLVDRLNKELPDAKFTTINAQVKITEKDKALPKPAVIDNVCCKVGAFGLCDPKGEPCKNRKEYLFFDGYHPTEMVNEVNARNAYNAPNPNYAHPMDVSHLVKL
ncbi:hypothetical protein Fmac_004520 [Flemingia macrophylla]|uniref:GDSL esterase/lipase n=1 Tax=Flemingia macrophylla TaxID=520843 RepID=A0ABD1N7T0_9FABA